MLFESIGRNPGTDNQDPLEAYLETPPLATVEDPIKYWELRAQSESAPGAALARMALDFLSIPGAFIHLLCHDLRLMRDPITATSTDIERAFSRGRLTISRLRFALGDKSVRASTLLGSWARLPGLVSEQDIVALIKNGGVYPPLPVPEPAANPQANIVDRAASDSDVEFVAGPSTSRAHGSQN